MYNDQREYRSALADYLKARLTGRVHEECHPYAAAAVADGIGTGRMWDRAFGTQTAASDLWRSLSQSDFPQMLATSLTATVAGDSSSASREHRMLCRTIELPDFKAADLGRVECGDVAAEYTPDTGPSNLPLLDVDNFTSARLRSFVAGLSVGRHLLLGDALSVINDATSQVGNALLKLEPRLIATLLEGTTNLGDGAALFSATNTGGSVGVDVTALAAAAEKLRTNVNGGSSALNVRARYWLVPPSKEIPARVLLASINQDGGLP